MLISAAVCPHPPLLVPEVAGGAAPELDGLRAAGEASFDAELLADAAPYGVGYLVASWVRRGL